MAGRGPQSFKKRQKEQQRKEWQEEKRARKLQRKEAKLHEGQQGPEDALLEPAAQDQDAGAEQVQNP